VVEHRGSFLSQRWLAMVHFLPCRSPVRQPAGPPQRGRKRPAEWLERNELVAGKLVTQLVHEVHSRGCCNQIVCHISTFGPPNAARSTCGERGYEFTNGRLPLNLAARRCKRWLGSAFEESASQVVNSLRSYSSWRQVLSRE